MVARIPQSVAPYYAELAGDHKATMLEMRSRIVEVIPGAQEIIKYGMPTFVVDADPIAGLKACSKHIGYYPYSGAVIEQFPELVAKYKTSKGALQVPLGAPLAKSVIRALIRARLKLGK